MTTLRRAVPADADDLTRLRAHMFAAMGQPPVGDWTGHCRTAFARRLATDDFAAWVVEDGGRVVSGGAGWVEQHLPSPRSRDGRRGHVASMSTEPAARRRGHATAVLGALLHWFAEQGIERVELRATPDGQPVYAAAGFRVLSGVTMTQP